jgi:hypothetical protein
MLAIDQHRRTEPQRKKAKEVLRVTVVILAAFFGHELFVVGGGEQAVQLIRILQR